MKVYSTYKLINYAETWRDPDNIKRTDLGMFKTLKKAKEAVFNEVNRYCLKNKRYSSLIITPDWHKCIDKRFPNSIYFEEIGSWAPTYIIQKVEVK